MGMEMALALRLLHVLRLLSWAAQHELLDAPSSGAQEFRVL